MATRSKNVAARPREYLRVSGPDAEDFLQRMLSNDVSADCEALLLTPKGRIIAPMSVSRRGGDDFVLATEPGLGETLRAALVRARLASKVEIEPEAFPDTAKSPPDEEAERARIEAGVPAWGKEIDESILPAEAGLDATHISFTKGCYPGQEPVARLRYRGHANRTLRRLEVGSAQPGDEIAYEGKTVGRITSAVPGIALGYVRREVPARAELAVGNAKARSLD